MINKQLYRFCGQARKYISLGVLANCLRLICAIGFSYMFVDLIENMTKGQMASPYLIAGIILVIAGKQVFIKLVEKANFAIVKEVKHSLRKAIYTKVLETGLSYRETLTTQEVIHLGVEGVEQLETYYGGYLVQFYYSFASSVILFFAIWPISLKAAIILLIAAPVIPLTLQLIMKMVRSTQKKYWKEYGDVGNLFLDSLQGLTTLKVFKGDEKRAEEMADQAESFRKQTMRLLAMQLNSITVVDLIAYGTAATVVIITILGYIGGGSYTLFGVLLLIMLSADFFVPMKSLTSLFHVAMTGFSAGESILEFLNRETPKSKGSKALDKDTTIILKDFSFTYPDGTEAVKKVNMEFKPGQVTALIGKSGCGKSTVAAVLSGRLKAHNPVIFKAKSTFSSEDLKSGQLAKNIVKIGHEPHLFRATVRKNVAMFNDRVTDTEIIEMMKKINMWDFLKEQQGLDTEILSQGKNLSGGQMQRMAIARAILGDFQVYIFDEATSGVDIESEEIILDIIGQLAKSKTVIYISHKMNMVKEANYIYLLDKGQLIEEGDHLSLMKEAGLYENLYREQEELAKYSRLVLGGSHDKQ